MNELGVDYQCTASRNRYDWYNFLNKPASVLRASEVAQTPFLCWLDADILVLNEPCQLVPGPNLDFVACAPSMDMHTVGPGSRYDAYWGASPIRAKTYGKESLCPSTWESCASEKGGISGMPRDIAQNYGAHVAVGAMFANELAIAPNTASCRY
jgi:hypothetical protein